MTGLRLLAADVRLYAAEARTGHHDTAIGVVLGAVFVIAVAWGTRGLVWVPTP